MSGNRAPVRGEDLGQSEEENRAEGFLTHGRQDLRVFSV